MDILIGIVLGLLGLFVTFAGLRVFFIALPIIGFFTGFFIGTIGMQALFGEGFLSTVLSWIAGFAVGIVFALISYLFWYAGALLAAGAAGASLGTGLMYLFGWNEIGLLMFLFGLAGFVLFFVGALLLNLPVYIVIVNTAFIGAFMTIGGVLLLFNQIDYQNLGAGVAVSIVDESFIWTLAWIVLSVAGIVSQINMIKDVTLPEERWAPAPTS
jgi:hypothetical protein